MSLAQSTLVQRVRRILGENPATQKATVADASDTTGLTCQDTTLFSVGSILEWQDNGEQVVVKSITNSTTFDVWARGHNGTTAQAHNAVAIYIDPQYPYVDVTNAIDRCIQGLWPYAWKKASDTITPSTSTDWYDFNATAIDLISVYQEHGTNPVQVAVYGAKDSGLAVEMRTLNTSITGLASGVGIRFPTGFAHASNTVYIDYRAKITSDLSGSNYSDISDGQLAEAVVYGAAAKLVGFKEIQLVSLRDVSQGETPIGPQARLTASSWLEEMYRRALHNAYDELMRTIPPMRRFT